MFTFAQSITWLYCPYRYGRVNKRSHGTSLGFFTTTCTCTYHLCTTASWPRLNIKWHYPDIHGCREETRNYIYHKYTHGHAIPLMCDCTGMVALRVGAGVDTCHYGYVSPWRTPLNINFLAFLINSLTCTSCTFIVFELLYPLYVCI